MCAAAKGRKMGGIKKAVPGKKGRRVISRMHFVQHSITRQGDDAE